MRLDLIAKGSDLEMKKSPLLLDLCLILLCLFLIFASPSNVSALSIDLDGCLLDVGVTCDLAGKQFFVTERNGNPNDPIVGSKFAKVSVSVEAFNPGAFPQNTDLVEFEYRYQIYDQQFAITNFILNLDFVPPPAVLDSGSIPDADPNTIAAQSASYIPQDLLYSAVFLGPPILPVTSGVFGSDVLFIRTSTSPADVVGILGGTETFADALVGLATLTGPGSGIVASVQAPAPTPSPQPEPSTLILLGSGLAGLGFFRRKNKKGV